MSNSYYVSSFSRAHNLKLLINKRSQKAFVSFYIVIEKKIKEFSLSLTFNTDVNKMIIEAISKILKKLDYEFEMGWEFSSKSAADAQLAIKRQYPFDVQYL